MIVYLRVIPGFWIAAEELRRPAIRLCPVVMGGLPHQRGAVREANALAQCSGVRPGMTLAQARQHCPEALFLVPDLPHYEAVWKRLCDILRTYTPLVEPIEPGRAVCDVSGCERQWQDPWATSHRLVARIEQSTGITPCLGVASNRLTAEIASTTAHGQSVAVVETGQERAFLAELPITLLPEIDPRLALTFKVLGLRTIGQFAALSAPAVRQRFGAFGARLHRYARGFDPRPVLPPPIRPAIASRHECEDGTIEEAVGAVHLLAERCAAELQKHNLAGRMVEVRLVWMPRMPCSPASGIGISRIREEPGEGAAKDLFTKRPQFLPGGSDATPPRLSSEPEGDQPIPISYRIHSMLPQPGPLPVDSGSDMETYRRSADPDSSSIIRDGHTLPAPQELCTIQTTRITVRTPIDTAPPLFEQAQRLLLQSRRSARAGNGMAGYQLHAIELEVSEFPAPAQLSFDEFNRLDGIGMLSGMSAGRLAILAQQEQILTARYGDTPFRHVADVEPDSVLTERRFRWGEGLPPRPVARRRA